MNPHICTYVVSVSKNLEHTSYALQLVNIFIYTVPGKS
uniref:Uncharacterized protein n=1 Tax=Arundo donax TaxID=35708 RepID=A0A0A9A037_ARUDO